MDKCGTKKPAGKPAGKEPATPATSGKPWEKFKKPTKK